MRGPDLVIHQSLAIPAAELHESASRSGGPGGQHVNKTSTRVTLRWNVAASAVLSDGQRARLLSRLRTRLTRSGDLVVHCGRSRVRTRNRELALEQLAGLVREGLSRKRPRVPTRATRASKQRTREQKKRRSAQKRLRGRVAPDSD